MIDGNNPPFTEEESKAISLAVLDIMMLMRQLDEKGSHSAVRLLPSCLL